MRSASEGNPVALRCPQCGASLPFGMEGYTVCQYCGSSLICDRRGDEAGMADSVVVRGMRLSRFTYTDSEGTGLELFRMLVPVRWKFQGGCRWLLNNPGVPGVVAFQLWNPQSAEKFEVLPNVNFTWNNNPPPRMMFPTGSRYFGAEVRPPVSIQEAFRGIVLPRSRSSVENLQILSEEPQPDLPRLVRSEAPVTGGSAEGHAEHDRRSGVEGWRRFSPDYEERSNDCWSWRNSVTLDPAKARPFASRTTS